MVTWPGGQTSPRALWESEWVEDAWKASASFFCTAWNCHHWQKEDATAMESKLFLNFQEVWIKVSHSTHNWSLCSFSVKCISHHPGNMSTWITFSDSKFNNLQCTHLQGIFLLLQPGPFSMFIQGFSETPQLIKRVHGVPANLTWLYFHHSNPE